jgi:hypothetical protein
MYTKSSRSSVQISASMTAASIPDWTCAISQSTCAKMCLISRPVYEKIAKPRLYRCVTIRREAQIEAILRTDPQIFKHTQALNIMLMISPTLSGMTASPGEADIFKHVSPFVGQSLTRLSSSLLNIIVELSQPYFRSGVGPSAYAHSVPAVH